MDMNPNGTNTCCSFYDHDCGLLAVINPILNCKIKCSLFVINIVLFANSEKSVKCLYIM